jgi:RimJ/RimL family protein N-acetyltransferase
LNKIDKPHLRANLGYWVRTSATRRGFATAAARLLARFGVEHLNLDRIEIVAAVDNIASQRVAEKLGAVREGVARHRLRIHDVPYDAVVYSLLRAEIVPPIIGVPK